MSTALVESPPPVASPAPDEEALYEIVNGERVELPPMGIYSNLVAGRIFLALERYLNEHRLGTAVTEALFILDRENNLRRRPDVAFVAADRWPLDREIPETGDWEVIPTLCVEVVSPSDSAGEVEKKTLEYFSYGVDAVWVVHSEHRRIYCYASPMDVTILDEQTTLDGSDLLPGFTMPLADLFRRTTAVNV